MRFQSVNRIGNGSLSHQQLTRGSSKAAMAAGRFKHDKAIYRREEAAETFHKSTLSNL
jgi:hypothetical protein